MALEVGSTIAHCTVTDAAEKILKIYADLKKPE